MSQVIEDILVLVSTLDTLFQLTVSCVGGICSYPYFKDGKFKIQRDLMTCSSSCIHSVIQNQCSFRHRVALLSLLL